jgi:photosystem II stability/assembly factor-like uncharacterized protein
VTPPRLVLFLVLTLVSSIGALSGFAQTITQQPSPEMRWRMIGPFRGGRTRAVAGVAGNPDIFYVAQVNGGVWKSDDAGRTWTPIFDEESTQSVGAIAVAPSDPNILYVGSGEGLHRPDLSVGNGMYKSTDAGKSWTNVGLHDAQQITAIAVDPRDPDRVYAAALGHPFGASTERGIFRSVDGGRSWKRVLYKDENTGANDLEIDPSNPDVLYAGLWEARLGPFEDNNEFHGTGGGLFKSTDGGDTWRQLKSGLPADLAQIDVAIAPSNPRRLYGIVETTQPTEYGTGAGMGMFRSDDAGESWVRITEDPRPVMLIGGGDLPVPKVDPRNPDVVYSASIVTSRSTDGGKTWMSLRGAPGGDDYQNVWISPRDSNVILLGSDQGAVVSVNGGRTWSSWYNQPTAQLYHIGITPTFPYRVCSGQQESGSVCIASRGDSGQITFRDWQPVGTIEYGYVTPDPLDPDVVYGGGRAEVTRFRWSTGQVENVTPIPLRGQSRVDRTEPLIFSPADPHILCYSSNVLFKTTNGGDSWQTISPDLTREHPGIPTSVGSMALKNQKAETSRGAIYAVAPGVHDVNTIWAGTDDGLLWVTRDGGTHWTNVTPPALTPWSKVTQISASHFDDATAYASVSRLRVDDLSPWIYRTHDGGKTWQSITIGLPASPVNTVREDPVRKGLLFAGTETGVWVSSDDGDHWQSLQMNLPHTSARDLEVHGDDLIVATHGRSFWILDGIAPLRQATAESSSAAAFLFQPGTAVRMRRSLNTDTPLPADEPAGENPPDGAIIDYSLGQGASGGVTLEILDSAGALVRRYASTDPPWITDQELREQMIPPYWVMLPQSLANNPGLHRWVWDLRYPAPVAMEHPYPISAVPHRTPRSPQGPLALPGVYTVRLTANGRTLTAPLTVTLDPRVKTPPAGITRMFEMQTRLAGMLSRSSEALLKAKSVDAQLKKLTARGTVKRSVDDFHTALTDVLSGPAEETSPRSAAQRPAKTTEAAPQRPSAAKAAKPPTLTSVQADVATLYEAIDRADAAPTQAQVEAIEATADGLDAVMKRWSAIEATTLPRLNSVLRRQHLSEVTAIADPAMSGGGMHEE